MAAHQLGLVTRRQAGGVGLGPDELRRRIERGEWVPLSDRVLKAAAAPDHVLTPAQAATLDVGRNSALARHTAAAFWDLPGFTIGPVEVIRARGGSTAANRLCIVHTSTAFDDGHVTQIDGIRVTTPIRTVFDLASKLHPLRTARLLDTCHNRGLVTWEVLHRTVEQLGKRGRSGTRIMRGLAAERPVGFRPHESRNEARVNELLVSSGQRPLTPQVDLGDSSWIGRVDLVDRADLVAVEVQSERYHGSLTDRRADAQRLARLTAAGWTVLELDEFAIWHRPSEVIGRIRAARQTSRASRFGTPSAA